MDSFGIEYIAEEVKKFIGNENITTNINRIQSNDSILGEYFYIGFISFMLIGKSLLDYVNLVSRNKY